MKSKMIFFLLSMSALCASAQVPGPRFHRLSYDDGLSNNTVNCIYKSSKGFLWIGTTLGLDRYDGYRIRSYFHDPLNPVSLPDGNIFEIAEDADGMLWMNTSMGYCVFNPVTETFERDIEGWMRRHGMKGRPRFVHADKRRDLWIATEEMEVYHYDFGTRRATLADRRCKLPRGHVSSITSAGGKVVLTYDNGTLACMDGKAMSVTWVNDYIPKHGGTGFKRYRTFVDSRGNYWVWWSEGMMTYVAAERRWKHFDKPLVTDVAEDRGGNILIATDHDGLLRVDGRSGATQKMLHSPADAYSLPDNTLSCIYVDNFGVVWIGAYRMGLVYYLDSQNKFGTLPLGDICTMAEGRDGTLWLGSNDVGILCYDFKTGRSRHIGRDGNRLRSDIVVSSLAAKDGSLWFGSYEGGLARIRDDGFTVYTEGASGLANNNVWALAELGDGRIAIGTLGSGVQLLNPATGRFHTFNRHNSGLKSDYVASLAVAEDGNVFIGHSQGMSLFDIKTLKITDWPGRNVDGTAPSGAAICASVNQVCRDSRGLVWVATISGLKVYDAAAGRLYTVDLQETHPYTDVCAVAEGRDGTMWVTTGGSVKSVRPRREGGGLKFYVNTYGRPDGLQARTLNKRSILCLCDGRVLIGGIDGVNVVNQRLASRHDNPARVVFSDIAVYDHVLGVGEKFNSHVILKEAINESRHVSLGHDESTFTVQLSTDNIGTHERLRFMYRLKGLDDRWMTTTENQPVVQFTNVPPGHYRLEVRAVDAYGKPKGQVETLDIIVRPPFYLSLWAWMLYVAAAMWAAWSVRRHVVRRRWAAGERMETQKRQEVEEMKMVFLTNISHELRTPLTLILSPLGPMIKREGDPQTREKMKMMQRNAMKLLDMVNQLLDLRRLVKKGAQLNLQRADVVSFVRGVSNQFVQLADKRITFTFSAGAETIMASFDSDKLGKIVYNLLSNAFKFTPAGGAVSVSVTLAEGGMVAISVADTGTGVSDEDKKRIFERFYQSAANGHAGGSGIGLNLAMEFAKMHGGTINVADRPGGGTVFTVTLPATDAETAGGKLAETTECATEHTEDAGTAPGGTTPEHEILVVDDNDDFLQFMVSELSPAYRVATAHDGEEALRLISGHRPDLVLTDIMMPGMDGNELCRRIKQGKDTADLPVMMLTARLSEENEIESRECGADDYVKKPFNIDLLHIRINRLVNPSRAHDKGKIEPKITDEKITSVDERFVADATAFVEKNISDTDLSVEQMSQELGMSRVKLYRRTVSVTGKTPSEFIRLIRLRHAEQLLAKSQLNISEIAYLVGFSSQRYFSKCFKELYGCLPSEYKHRQG